MKHLEVLRAELERVYDLNHLIALSKDVLGFDPERIGGQATLSSFAGALLTHCSKEDALAALLDAVRAQGHELSPGLNKLGQSTPLEESLLIAGEELNGFHITRKLFEDRLGVVYLAKGPGGDVRLRVLHPEACRDRRGLQRFLAATRLIGALNHAGFPQLISAGTVQHRSFVAHAHVEGQALSARIGRTGAMHINEARPILRSIAESLAALHAAHLCHGALGLDQVLMYRAGAGQGVALMEAGVGCLSFEDPQVAPVWCTWQAAWPPWLRSNSAAVVRSPPVTSTRWAHSCMNCCRVDHLSWEIRGTSPTGISLTRCSRPVRWHRADG